MLHIVSALVRFLFSFFRIPFLRLSNLLGGGGGVGGGNGTANRSQSQITEAWIRSLEEETGASSSSSSSTSTNIYPPQKHLPAFLSTPYTSLVSSNPHQIICVVLLSREHDDCTAFIHNTLTSPSFLSATSTFLFWGGDVRNKEAWQVAERLGVTTYPFVAFLALQPSRSSSSSSNSQMTVLSRHAGKSQTSLSTLLTHISTSLIPRISPYLSHLAQQSNNLLAERALRLEQDRQYALSIARDNEKAEAARRAEEEERVESIRLASETAKRDSWRTLSHSLVTTQMQGGSLKLAIRLPKGTRLIVAFTPNTDTLTHLYAYISTHIHSSTSSPLPSYSESNPHAALESYLSSCSSVKSFWGFDLYTSFPRAHIPWKPNTPLSSVGALASGGQIIVESLVAESQHDSDSDGYKTEEDSE